MLNGSITASNLSASDLFLDMKQKGVDMRIGLDISSQAFKKQVQQIILDPMHSPIKEDLFEHIDGMPTRAPKVPVITQTTAK